MGFARCHNSLSNVKRERNFLLSHVTVNMRRKPPEPWSLVTVVLCIATGFRCFEEQVKSAEIAGDQSDKFPCHLPFHQLTPKPLIVLPWIPYNIDYVPK
jgi:hypothetical protein